MLLSVMKTILKQILFEEIYKNINKHSHCNWDVDWDVLEKQVREEGVNENSNYEDIKQVVENLFDERVEEVEE